MTDELQFHWTLHEIDEEAAVHEAERAKLPEQRRAAESRMAAERRRLAALDAAATAAMTRRRTLEQEIAALEAQEKKYRTQLDAVTNQQQFTAVQHEIAGVAGKRSDLETEALTLMDTEERAAAERPALASLCEKAEREGAAVLARGDAEEARLASLLAALTARRTETAARLAAPSRARYERARALRGGRGIAELLIAGAGATAAGSCGGCHGGQSPHVLQEARKREQLLVCDGCGRLLMLPPG